MRSARWPSACNFCARGVPDFFKNFASFFARVGRKICVIPTLDAFFFASECNADSINSIGDVLKYAQRTLAECTQFLCAGRAEFPEILQIFRAIFAQNLHHLGA